MFTNDHIEIGLSSYVSTLEHHISAFKVARAVETSIL